MAQDNSESSTSLRVLVAEDNRGDVSLIERGLEESDVDCSMTVVGDGEALLDHLHRRNEDDSTVRPGLVILDLNLPKRTGRDVLERIDDDAGLASVPILVLTGSKADDHVLETYELGADGYFVKPADPHEFMSLMERVVDSVSSTRTSPPGAYADLDRVS